MDIIQKHAYNDCRTFIGDKFEHCIRKSFFQEEVAISLSRREAYVVMKVLEDQQRYLNPLREVDKS